MRRKYESERHIVVKCNNSKTLEAKWKRVLDCNLLGTQVCNQKTQEQQQQQQNLKGTARIVLQGSIE